jgi:hypothetical protein
MNMRKTCRAVVLIVAWSGIGLGLPMVNAEDQENKANPVNYARPFEPPTRPALIPLPPGAIEPAGWLRDWAMTARDGFTGTWTTSIRRFGTHGPPTTR